MLAWAWLPGILPAFVAKIRLLEATARRHLLPFSAALHTDLLSPAGYLPRAPHYASMGSFPRNPGQSPCLAGASGSSPGDWGGVPSWQDQVRATGKVCEAQLPQHHHVPFSGRCYQHRLNNVREADTCPEPPCGCHSTSQGPICGLGDVEGALPISPVPNGVASSPVSPAWKK